MDYELTVPMPLVPLAPGGLVKLEAISPTTGAAVTGVLVANATITARDLSDTTNLTPDGVFMWVPGPEA